MSLLGSFRVLWQRREIALPEGGQRVVAYLALKDPGVTRRALAAALWPDVDAGRALPDLRSALWRIRRVIPNLIRREGQRLSLDPSFSVDARELDQVVQATLDAPDRAGREDLVALTHADELLADWDDGWINLERERMRQLRLEALERMAEDLTERGLVGQAVEAGLAAVADDPFRESAHRVLIEAYLRKGNAAAAFDQFRRYQSAVRAELGVSPSDDLVARIRPLVGRRPTRAGRR